MKKHTKSQKNAAAKKFFAINLPTLEDMENVLKEFGITPMTEEQSGYPQRRTYEEQITDLFEEQMIEFEYHFRVGLNHDGTVIS